MYTFLEDIRIRICDELSFLVNIKDNSFAVIKTETLLFLQNEMKKGLSPEKLNKMDQDFIVFIQKLENNGILGVVENAACSCAWRSWACDAPPRSGLRPKCKSLAPLFKGSGAEAFNQRGGVFLTL